MAALYCRLTLLCFCGISALSCIPSATNVKAIVSSVVADPRMLCRDEYSFSSQMTNLISHTAFIETVQ